jgi:hypothetical protein
MPQEIKQEMGPKLKLQTRAKHTRNNYLTVSAGSAAESAHQESRFFDFHFSFCLFRVERPDETTDSDRNASQFIITCGECE